MQTFVFTIPVFGLLGCLFIACKPHVMADKVAQVQHMWPNMLLVEKIGLVFMLVPMPGPLDEAIGLLFLGAGRIQRRLRSRKQRRWLDQQFAEDTCNTHNVWCCDKCFDMSTVG